MENQSLNQKPATKTKNNLTTIIIIVILIILVVLSLGGYFGWRYFKNYFGKKISDTEEQTTSSTSTSSKVDNLVEIFKYPKATVINSSFGTDYNIAASIEMETGNTPTVVYHYYEDLISLNNWLEGSRGLSTNGDGGWLKVEENDFQAEITIKTKKDNPNIIELSVIIRSSSDEVTSSRKKLSSSLNSSSSDTDSSNETTTSPKGGEMPINGYVISDSDKRIISESEITSFTPWQLKVARNEIYARHGRKFIHQDLSCYFATQDWYSIDENYTENSLSYVENKNVATILDYEEKIASPFLRVDSGC